MIPPSAHKAVVGVILAGGVGQRLGGAVKPLLSLGHETVLQCLTRRAYPQVGLLALSVHQCPEQNCSHPFADFPGPLLADPPEFLQSNDRAGRVGPLAGIAAALMWAQKEGARWVAVFPGDTPFIPKDYVSRLLTCAQQGNALAAYAVSARKMHPTSSLWSVELSQVLWDAVATGERRVGRWLMAQGALAVEWPMCPNGDDPFFNINEPKDLEQAQGMIHPTV